MSKRRLKHLYNKTPNKDALPPLLNKEAEERRLKSIEEEKKKQNELETKSKRLNKFIFDKK